MNINDINIKIETIKYPYIFLFLLLTYKSDISNNNFNIILKLYLKNHIDVALNINLIKLFSDNNLILKEFYKLIKKKLLLIFRIKKFHNIYKNIIFWKLNTNDQIDYILNLKLQFLSIYDCSKGGYPYHLKLENLLNISNISRPIVIENLKERLLLILKLFDINIFESLEIPLIKSSDFYNLDNEYYIKYLTIIFQKFNKLLNDTLFLLETFNLVCNSIDNLLNPRIINIIDNYYLDIDIID